jgi:hypothetical protein
MIYTDPDASRKLINNANRYHWEKEGKHREASRKEIEHRKGEALLLMKSEREQCDALMIKQLSHALKCEDDVGCSAADKEGPACLDAIVAGSKR